MAEEGKPTPRPRPVKIVMDSFEMKMGILKNARKLKDSDKFNRIGLSYDKTKKEQEDYRKLKVKLDEKKPVLGHPGPSWTQLSSIALMIVDGCLSLITTPFIKCENSHTI